ncbi:MAG TPA: ABC-F family ATP-binding cassette domain-containing protein, partial [Thermoanaerobaculia bacterium]|nr:ABC-F family ATP-binding cassette domain-containing protein [Thermoanaerobaculia bacterium]
LKILAGIEPASDGTVAIPKRLTVGYLEQDHFQYEATPILEVAMMGDDEVWRAMRDKDELLERAHEEFDGDRYAELEDLILTRDGYALEARAGEVLEGLGIPAEVHRQPLSTLSGGFKLRVLLAKVLAAKPDALLLDEPTNHLDIVSIRWLEKFLQGYEGIAVVVSHDHRFLDNVCDQIVDVDYETALLYPGSYSAFEEAKHAERERRQAEQGRLEKKIADHQAFVDRFRAKATKARQAQSKVKLIEKMAGDLEPLPQSSRRYPTFRFGQRRPSGKDVLVLDGISKAYGDNQVLEDVSLTVRRGDRLAIIGPNGIGKSTLLKIAVGEVKQDAGKVEWGYEAHPGYFAQDQKEIFQGSRQSVEAWLWQVCPTEPIGFVRAHLGAVLFSGDDVKKAVGSLSGGEGARLVFSRLTVEKPNVMVLDEPTNHLDLEAIEALVEALRAYEGTLILVSHDRWFVSELADRIVEIEPTGIEDFRGSYDEYIEALGDDHLDAEQVLLKVKRERKEKRARAERTPEEERERQRRVKELERRRDRVTDGVEKAEARVGAINETFCDPAYFERTPQREVRKLEAEQHQLKERIDELMAEWEEIEAELQELTETGETYARQSV